MRAVEALQRDVLAVLTRPVVVGRFWVDLKEAQRVVRESATEGVRLSLTHLIVKATAMAALASPDIHRMFGPLTAVDPGHADVGVSVEGQEILAPVVVIREADRKSLVEIAQELRELAKEAREKETRDVVLIQRWLKFFPFPGLRRLLIRAFWSIPRIRRQAAGTVQFSNIGSFGIEAAHVPVVAELLLVGGVLQRLPMVDEHDAMVVGVGAEFTVHGAHRKVNGQSCGKFTRTFREVLGRPEALR